MLKEGLKLPIQSTDKHFFSKIQYFHFFKFTKKASVSQKFDILIFFKSLKKLQLVKN